jgi:GNAT superfamily N-acetyltransferase
VNPTIRIATQSDLRFIRSSWFDSYWHCYAKKKIEGVVYRSEMRLSIERLLKRSNVLVAFFDEVPDEVLGWSACEGQTCHYVYVKGDYRRQGLGKGLVPPQILYYSHATDAQGRLFANSVNMKFNPFRTQQEHP